MSWFKKLMPARIRTEKSQKDRQRSVPEGLWGKCAECQAVLYRPELERNLNVCPKCDHHMPIRARKRLELFLDEDNQIELFGNLQSLDPLKFRDSKKYRDRLISAQKKSGEKDALIVISGSLEGKPVICCAFDFSFMGGSMGSVVGEKFTRAGEYALKNRIPFVCYSASGGARMQEGLLSLMQMAKTSAVLARMAAQGVPYISVLTHPTTGGVTASLAMLGDVNIAEPNALIGFAGPRVIEQTVRQTLPDGFQRSEFLLNKGTVDMIIDRREMRTQVSMLLQKLSISCQPVSQTG